MSKRTVWRLAFLGMTATVVGLELVASFDNDVDTRPWTQEIVDHVPGEVAAAAIGALVCWLPVHFGIRYWKKSSSR